MGMPIDVKEWTVLVVDDHSDFTMLVQKIMGHHGVTVQTTQDSLHCVEVAEQLQPTLIITDLSMPEMDGWAVLTALRENPATMHIPVVAITAYHSPQVAADAIRVGFDAYFPKPVEAGSFVSKLVEIFSNQ